ncbi:MAG TPA: sulfur reduction protein DsrE [Firmicutes bacterium]|nr:sulfur reduction protein DsrE [Bacillota bacterium]
MSEKKKILYVQTSGPATPERQYAPLILAQTAVAMDIEPIVFYLGLGLKVLLKGEAAKIKIGAFPALQEVMRQAVAQGVKIMACQQSIQLFGGEINPADLTEEAVIAGAATLNDLALDADAILTF